MNFFGPNYNLVKTSNKDGTKARSKYFTDDILEQSQNSSFKGSSIFNDLFLSMFNYKKEPEDRLYFNQLDQNVISHNLHIKMPRKSHFLYSTFDWKIKQLIQGGFFNVWIERYKSHSSVQSPQPDPDKGKVVLTMDHLSVGFIIWLVSLAIASAVMVLEHARFHLSNFFYGTVRRIILRRLQSNN